MALDGQDHDYCVVVGEKKVKQDTDTDSVTASVENDSLENVGWVSPSYWIRH